MLVIIMTLLIMILVHIQEEDTDDNQKDTTQLREAIVPFFIVDYIEPPSREDKLTSFCDTEVIARNIALAVSSEIGCSIPSTFSK